MSFRIYIFVILLTVNVTGCKEAKADSNVNKAVKTDSAVNTEDQGKVQEKKVTLKKVIIEDNYAEDIIDCLFFVGDEQIARKRYKKPSDDYNGCDLFR